MRTVIFKSCFKDDMQSFMEYRVATFAWNTYRLDNYRLSSFDRYLTKIPKLCRFDKKRLYLLALKNS
mgnify:CR=1 FL=1